MSVGGPFVSGPYLVVLRACSWQDQGNHTGCQESNPVWLHVKTGSVPLYYPFDLPHCVNFQYGGIPSRLPLFLQFEYSPLPHPIPSLFANTFCKILYTALHLALAAGGTAMH